MLKLGTYAFVTGLHLALLQFGYFFLLAINVSSAYITYISIVISWMAGTLLGLLWKNLDARLALGMGVVAYYAIYALVLSFPLALGNLAPAVTGVLISGLWAGRFFTVMLPFFERADSLFFHENNGFLVGVVGTFIGFTLLGRDFLLWGPVLSGAVLLAYMSWIGVRARVSL